MTTRIALLAAACAFAASLPASPAGHAGGACGGTFRDEKSCFFYVRGLPIAVEGKASNGSGTASIHVWVTMEGTAGPALAECAGDAREEVSCEGELGVGTLLDSTRQLFIVECHVEGVSSGTYGCLSALGI